MANADGLINMISLAVPHGVVGVVGVDGGGRCRQGGEVMSI